MSRLYMQGLHRVPNMSEYVDMPQKRLNMPQYVLISLNMSGRCLL